MPTVVIVDTSIFLNMLNVSGFNQNRSEVIEKFSTLIKSTSTSLILPLCAIVETGNHISQIADGRLRRRFAELFVTQVLEAFHGQAPWQTTQTLDLSRMAVWLHEFPDSAMRGVGIADLAMIKEWESACKMYPRHDVFIWSLDPDLASHNMMR